MIYLWLLLGWVLCIVVLVCLVDAVVVVVLVCGFDCVCLTRLVWVVIMLDFLVVIVGVLVGLVVLGVGDCCYLVWFYG